MPSDNAERVIEGARNLSPNLGERMLAAHIGGRPVIIRELLPQDLKLDIETLPQAEALAVGHYLGSIVGKAHARQLDEAALGAWTEEMRRNRLPHLDAPAWLWEMILELAGAHEVGLSGSLPRVGTDRRAVHRCAGTRAVRLSREGSRAWIAASV